jgi:hypothetical protein
VILDLQSPGEIYEDEKGNRWLVVSMCQEPTVTMQAIEPFREDCPPPKRLSGGVSGYMWQGFRKIADAPDQTP